MEKNENNSYLSFKLGNEIFSAHTKSVLHILEMQKITKVPQAPNYMMGVFNLRGNVLPVIDSRIKFGLEISELTNDSCIVVTEIRINEELVQVGMLVDAVMEVIEIDEGQIQPPPSVGSEYNSKYIKGLIKLDEKFIMLLDIDHVLSTEEITSLMMNEQVAE